MILSWVLTLALLFAITDWMRILLPSNLDQQTMQYMYLGVNLAGTLIAMLLAFYARSDKALKNLSDIIIGINLVNLINLVASSVYLLA